VPPLNNSLADMSDSMKTHQFNPTILREYDIRGQIGKTLSEADAYALGLAFGTYVARENGSDTPGDICVGFDGRESSPALSDALIRGLQETGAHVINVGLGPTPMLYFSVKDLKAAAGIMVTGSHNPSDYNGFKMTLQSRAIFGEHIQDIGKIAASGKFMAGNGSGETRDIQDDYVDRLMQDLDNTQALNIAWDAGNGAAGEILKRLTQRLPGTHTLLYADIDGSFPNHHPDPTVDENLRDLQKAVAEHNCDLGIAFDGDGDRIGVVDENGTVLRCDMLMTLYARDVLAAHPGAAIIGDVKCSSVMFDEIARLGGQPVMWKTGHSLVKAKMAEMDAPLAGELSGHIFFADRYYGFDDALYCAVRLINALKDGEGALSTLTQHLPKLYSTPEIRFEVDETEKFDLVPRLQEILEQEGAFDGEMNTIDGIRVTNTDGWWLIRPSNTQSVLVARAEAHSKGGLQRLKDNLKTNVKKIGYHIDI
jgi:phosphomannomutase